jgi:hypothetical protein
MHAELFNPNQNEDATYCMAYAVQFKLSRPTMPAVHVTKCNATYEPVESTAVTCIVLQDAACTTTGSTISSCTTTQANVLGRPAGTCRRSHFLGFTLAVTSQCRILKSQDCHASIGAKLSQLCAESD